jgi:hypothetical protein
MHVVVHGVFILNLVCASFAPIEVRKLIISKLMFYVAMSLRAVKSDPAASQEPAPGTSVNWLEL